MNHCSIAYTFYERDFRVCRYSEMLKNDDNRVDVIALRKENEPKQNIIKGVNVYKIQKRNFNEKGFFCFFLKILLFFLKGSFFLLKNQLKFKYKIIHIHNVPDFLVFMAIMPKLLGAKIILDIHDILPELFCEKFNKSFDSFLGRMLLLIESLSIKFADHVIVANDIWREKIINRHKLQEKKCSTLLNYPNLKRFKGIQPNYNHKQQLRLLYPGHISHHHGIDIAIKGFAIIKQYIENAQFDIYPGSYVPDYKQYIDNLIEKLNLEKNVLFHPPYVLNEIADVFGNASIGIVPKRGGSFASEAFSTKILEFMAAGIPVVASKTKIDEYYFDDKTIKFFKEEDYKEMAKKVLTVFSDVNERKSLAQNGFNYVSINNWEIKKQIYLNIISVLVK
jgi:glycosyltransferase involved in cell wall biosynthesis